MILEAIILGGVLAVGYQSWRQQQTTYNQNLLVRQQQTTQCRKKKSDEKSLETSQPKRRSSQDLASISMAVFLSGSGLLLYPYLAYLSLPFLIYPVRRKFINAWVLLKRGKIDIETLSTASIIGAVIGQRFFIGSLLGMTTIIGERLASRTIHDSHHHLVDVFQEMPETISQLKGNAEISIPSSSIKAGDVLVVSAGEVIPVDGLIVWGVAGIDEHRFTGEAIPKEKTDGDNVFAMTLVLSGKIHIRTEKASTETSAMKIAEILNQTAEYKSLTVLRAENFSRQLVKPALITSTIAWSLLGFSSAIGVLLTHPKERLLVSSPISLLRYLKRASEESMLIKDGRSLELLNQVDTIVFDKTGTLTEEQPHIGNIYSFSNYDENEVLNFAAIAEYKQTHPLAQAILNEAKQRGLSNNRPDHSEYRLGYGVKVMMNEQVIFVGSHRFMISEGFHISEFAQQLQDTTCNQGHGLIMVAVNDQLIGAIELLPTLRPEARAVIQRLKQMKHIKKTYIISGDSVNPTRHLAQELGIDHYFAQTLPQQKAELIKQLQKNGAFVCYVGDGINDAIAMKQAQVSVSLRGASQVATDTAQILLLDQGIHQLPRLFQLAKGFHGHMNSQFSIVLATSIFGVSMIFLGGWGMGQMMTLNILSLSATLGYSLVDQPVTKIRGR